MRAAVVVPHRAEQIDCREQQRGEDGGPVVVPDGADKPHAQQRGHQHVQAHAQGGQNAVGGHAGNTSAATGWANINRTVDSFFNPQPDVNRAGHGHNRRHVRRNP